MPQRALQHRLSPLRGRPTPDRDGRASLTAPDCSTAIAPPASKTRRGAWTGCGAAQKAPAVLAELTVATAPRSTRPRTSSCAPSPRPWRTISSVITAERTTLSTCGSRGGGARLTCAVVLGGGSSSSTRRFGEGGSRRRLGQPLDRRVGRDEVTHRRQSSDARKRRQRSRLAPLRFVPSPRSASRMSGRFG